MEKGIKRWFPFQKKKKAMNFFLLFSKLQIQRQQRNWLVLTFLYISNTFLLITFFHFFPFPFKPWTCLLSIFTAQLLLYDGLGVFLVKMKNAFAPVKRAYSVNTHSTISTFPWGSERSEWASPWTELASEASIAKQSKVSIAKQSAAEQVSGVSGASERT